MSRKLPGTERDDGCRAGVRSVCDVGLVASRESRFAHGIAYGQIASSRKVSPQWGNLRYNS